MAALFDPRLGSTGHYLKAPCTKPCGISTCLPCPRGTFLAWENHHKTRCARCQACDEEGAGLPGAWGQGGSGGQALAGVLLKKVAGSSPAFGWESPVRTPPWGPLPWSCLRMPLCPLILVTFQPLLCGDLHISLTLGVALSLVSSSPFSGGRVLPLCGALWL